MSMHDEADAYQTYVLRMWRVRCQGKWQWRVFIKSPHTAERHAFGSLEQLFDFLSEKCEQQNSVVEGEMQ
jgi:hypothetical protein